MSHVLCDLPVALLHMGNLGRLISQLVMSFTEKRAQAARKAITT